MIGWILLSRNAVASAEQALNDQTQGVRDEIGLLALHQAFSDLFFPGTSVLHTRLRYALFIPWLFERSGGESKRLRDDLLQLTKQLKDSGQDAIGGTIWPREPVQSAAMAYWSALSRWGILQPRLDNSTPTRKQALQRIALLAQRDPISKRVLEGEPLWSDDHSPFCRLPPAPAELLVKGKPLDFALSDTEREFLRRQLMALHRADGSQSLLGRLAENRVSVVGADTPWHKSIWNAADASDRRCLKLAEGTATLAGIARAVYSALVEQAKNRDGGGTSREYRDHLTYMQSQHEASASSLDLEALHLAIPNSIPGELSAILRETQAWLRSGRKDCSILGDIYARAERNRKGLRARLGPSKGNRSRREEWNTPKMPHPKAETLHYRWPKVRTLLNDLVAT